MSDFLLDLAANPNARKLVTTLGLPLPMPQALARADGPWEERPLADRDVVVLCPAGGEDTGVAAALARTLPAAGANPWVVGEPHPAFAASGEAWSRPARAATAEAPPRPWALVVDATGWRRPEDLRDLLDFFQPRVKALARSGRAVVIGRPPADAEDAVGSAVQRALEGFVRSLGRELGRSGATANLVLVEEGAEDRLEPVLRFLLSTRSAYVSGQPMRVGRKLPAAPARWTRPLEGKVALVTGAARGIGEAIAGSLAREGARVIVLDRPDDGALGSEVAARIGGVFVGADVTDPATPERLAARIDADFGGRLDIAIHNAGITRDRTLAKLSPDAWDLTIDVNLGAVIRLHEALLPKMPAEARIVCLSSIAGLAGNVGQTNYAASKAAIAGYVAALAPKLARKKIAVNAIAPGFIETRLTDAIPVATREVARRLCNLGQGGLPIDIAEVATFLSSPGASGITGQVIRVCGGSFVGA